MKTLLSTVFIEPKAALSLDLPQWDLLIRQARHANVLARLRSFLQDADILGQVPAQPLQHLNSADIYYQRFHISLDQEIKHIKAALDTVGEPVRLLKGAAYLAAQDAAATGRTFTDVDILVPEQHLPEVEMALIKAGWMTHTLSPYDQKYYRQWMHEIPPLRHLVRQSSIDVHHNILPKTSRFCPDPGQLLANSVQLAGTDYWLLAPEDRVLHSAAHLFHEGEFSHGFRDLSDLDLLLKQYSQQDNFWQQLLHRANTLHQQLPLFYALRYSHHILHTPVPASVLATTRQYASNKVHALIMDALFLRALLPDHDSCNDRWTGLARWLLYVRSHWLKMPLYLVLPHLLRKSVMRLTGQASH